MTNAAEGVCERDNVAAAATEEPDPEINLKALYRDSAVFGQWMKSTEALRSLRRRAMIAPRSQEELDATFTVEKLRREARLLASVSKVAGALPMRTVA